MAARKAADNVLTWIADEQLVHEQADYGDNQKAVSDALREQKKRQKLVADYSADVTKFTETAKDPDVIEKVTKSYDELSTTASKREGCLTDIAQIASMEELFNSLSVTFAQRATNLVADACAEPNNNAPEAGGALGEGGAAEGPGGEGITRSAQSCILAVRNNWQWISKLVKCTDIHLEHVSNYHQFFHTAKEYEQWMPIDLDKAEKRLARPENAKGTKQETQKILLELKEILVVYLHWMGKINALFEQSKKVLPIQLRTKPLETYRPISVLVNYKTKEIAVQESEELTLLDNSSPQMWLVRNMHAREASVPSVICVIPGPDPDAVALAMRLRLRFLGIWTLNVKRIGKTMIWFLLQVFNDPDKDLSRALQSLDEYEQDDVNSSLNLIIKSLSKYWGEYPDFQTLQTRVKRVKELVKEGDGKGGDKEGAEQLADNVKTLDQLLRRYKDFWSNWETCKVLVETANHAEQILIVDKWQQLNFINTSELLKKWHSGGLGFDASELVDGDSTGMGSGGSGSRSDDLAKFSELMDGVDGAGGGAGGSGGADGQNGEGSFGSGEDSSLLTKTTTTTLEASMGGDGGAGGSGGSGGSGGAGGAGALMMGQEGFAEGSFGMEEFTTGIETEEVISEETSESLEGGFSNGMATTIDQTSHSAETEQISTSEQEEKKTFVITGVIDPRSGEEVSMHQAVMLGIINNKTGTYVNPDTGLTVPIPQAMNEGHIKVEFTTTKKSKEKKRDVGLITIKTQRESRPYTVRAVVDALSEKQLSVDDAIKNGILNQANGVYHNTRENLDMSLADALDSGLLIVEFDKDAPEVAPEVVTKTYAIHAVVDQKTKSKVSFSEAVRKGLINKSTGAYRHTVNKEDIYVGDAIKRGFIKATVVKDPSSMDIDPENKMVVDKVDMIRKKILTPMKAMAALKKAGDDTDGSPGQVQMWEGMWTEAMKQRTHSDTSDSDSANLDDSAPSSAVARPAPEVTTQDVLDAIKAQLKSGEDKSSDSDDQSHTFSDKDSGDGLGIIKAGGHTKDKDNKDSMSKFGDDTKDDVVGEGHDSSLGRMDDEGSNAVGSNSDQDNKDGRLNVGTAMGDGMVGEVQDSKEDIADYEGSHTIDQDDSDSMLKLRAAEHNVVGDVRESNTDTTDNVGSSADGDTMDQDNDSTTRPGGATAGDGVVGGVQDSNADTTDNVCSNTGGHTMDQDNNDSMMRPCGATAGDGVVGEIQNNNTDITDGIDSHSKDNDNSDSVVKLGATREDDVVREGQDSKTDTNDDIDAGATSDDTRKLTQDVPADHLQQVNDDGTQKDFDNVGPATGDDETVDSFDETTAQDQINTLTSDFIATTIADNYDDGPNIGRPNDIEQHQGDGTTAKQSTVPIIEASDTDDTTDKVAAPEDSNESLSKESGPDGDGGDSTNDSSGTILVGNPSETTKPEEELDNETTNPEQKTESLDTTPHDDMISTSDNIPINDDSTTLPDTSEHSTDDIQQAKKSTEGSDTLGDDEENNSTSGDHDPNASTIVTVETTTRTKKKRVKKYLKSTEAIHVVSSSTQEEESLPALLDADNQLSSGAGSSTDANHMALIGDGNQDTLVQDMQDDMGSSSMSNLKDQSLSGEGGELSELALQGGADLIDGDNQAKDGNAQANDSKKQANEGKNPANDGDNQVKDDDNQPKDGDNKAKDGDNLANDGDKQAKDCENQVNDSEKKARSSSPNDDLQLLSSPGLVSAVYKQQQGAHNNNDNKSEEVGGTYGQKGSSQLQHGADREGKDTNSSGDKSKSSSDKQRNDEQDDKVPDKSNQESHDQKNTKESQKKKGKKKKGKGNQDDQVDLNDQITGVAHTKEGDKDPNQSESKSSTLVTDTNTAVLVKDGQSSRVVSGEITQQEVIGRFAGKQGKDDNKDVATDGIACIGASAKREDTDTRSQDASLADFDIAGGVRPKEKKEIQDGKGKQKHRKRGKRGTKKQDQDNATPTAAEDGYQGSNSQTSDQVNLSHIMKVSNEVRFVTRGGASGTLASSHVGETGGDTTRLSGDQSGSVVQSGDMTGQGLGSGDTTGLSYGSGNTTRLGFQTITQTDTGLEFMELTVQSSSACQDTTDGSSRQQSGSGSMFSVSQDKSQDKSKWFDASDGGPTEAGRLDTVEPQSLWGHQLREEQDEWYDTIRGEDQQGQGQGRDDVDGIAAGIGGVSGAVGGASLRRGGDSDEIRGAYGTMSAGAEGYNAGGSSAHAYGTMFQRGRHGLFAAQERDIGAVAAGERSHDGLYADLSTDEENEVVAAALKTEYQDERRNMLARVCRAALPVQLLMLILLGFACFVPFCETDCDIGGSTLDRSLAAVLRYNNGPPPF